MGKDQHETVHPVSNIKTLPLRSTCTLVYVLITYIPSERLLFVVDIVIFKSVCRLLMTCVIVITWGIYITLYNARVVGKLLTFVINKMYKGAHIKFGMIIW